MPSAHCPLSLPNAGILGFLRVLLVRCHLPLDQPTISVEREPILKTTKLIAAFILCALIAVPSISFAKARGGGGGFSGGSRGGGNSQSFGSRGSRTFEQNSAKPIEQSATARPATPAPQQAGGSPPAQPAAQPSFFQRNPLMAGIAGGLAGSWIGHMLFGATDSSAAGATDGTAGGFNFINILLLMLLAGGVFYYFLKVRRTPAPVLSGLTRRSTVGGPLLAESRAAVLSTETVKDIEVTAADKSAFQQLLVEIQTAWGKQDLATLRRLVTPEIFSHFSTGLAEHTSQEIQNHVEDVVLVRAEVREAWNEDSTQYATAALRWTARDYTVSLTKQPGEPGYLVEGNEKTPTESSEVWTFMRHQNGKWLLSAIQQVE